MCVLNVPVYCLQPCALGLIFFFLVVCSVNYHFSSDSAKLKYFARGWDGSELISFRK